MGVVCSVSFIGRRLMRPAHELGQLSHVDGVAVCGSVRAAAVRCGVPPYTGITWLVRLTELHRDPWTYSGLRPGRYCMCQNGCRRSRLGCGMKALDEGADSWAQNLSTQFLSPNMKYQYLTLAHFQNLFWQFLLHSQILS